MDCKKTNAEVLFQANVFLDVFCRGVRSRNFVGPNPILIRNHNSCILILVLFYNKKLNPDPDPDPVI